MKYKKQLFFCLTLLWVFFIFSFSIQPGEKSDVISDSVGNVIIENSSSEVRDQFETFSYEQWTMFHKVIRKLGHFVEFFILGILIILNLWEMQVIHKKSIGLLLCAAVACIDETIQLFVPGRSGQVSDVLLDCFGSFVGMCVCVIVTNLFLRKRENHGH